MIAKLHSAPAGFDGCQRRSLREQDTRNGFAVSVRPVCKERQVRKRRSGFVTRASLALPAAMHASAAWAQSGNAGRDAAIEYVAPWPPWVSLVLVALAAAFSYGFYYREQIAYRSWVKFALATLRFALLCIVLWMMYGYTLRSYRTDLPDLLLILDNSKSMQTVDAVEDEAMQQELDRTMADLKLDSGSRLNQAKAVLLNKNAKLISYLQENYQLKLASLASELETGNLADRVRELGASLEVSELGRVLRQSLQRHRGRPVAAVVFLTDGITTDGPPLSEIASEARQREIPLHVVAIGSQLPAKDIRLSDLLVDDVVFLGDLITFSLTLSGDGYENESVEISLRRADGSGETITQQIQLTSASDAEQVRLAWQADEKGSFDFIIDTPARDGEVSIENNALRATVEVRDEKTRVLLIQAYPSYEYHYLKTLLERKRGDPRTQGLSSIDLSVLLQDADSEFADIDASAIRSFPTRDDLFTYDVCIFGDVNPGFLGTDALADLRDFVRERGRGFVGIAGPRYFPSRYADTPLAEIIPFDIRGSVAVPPDLPIETGFRPRITPLGQRTPAMRLSLDPQTNAELWAALPELYWMLEVDRLKPGVRVLAEHPEKTNTSGRPLPIATLSYVGAGKVWFQYTDDSWRWRIGHGDEYFGRYWHQAIRFLSRFKLGEGRDVELTSDRETYNRGELVRLRARFFDERRAPDDESGVLVMLTQQGRGQRRVMLRRAALDRGVFAADVANLATGKYHAWISDPATDGMAPSADFEIITPDTELTRLTVDAADLRRAAEISGGRYYTYETAEEILKDLPAGRQVRIEPLPPRALWNSWKVAMLFVLLLVAEWLLRRQVGMV